MEILQFAAVVLVAIIGAIPGLIALRGQLRKDNATARATAEQADDYSFQRLRAITDLQAQDIAHLRQQLHEMNGIRDEVAALRRQVARLTEERDAINKELEAERRKVARLQERVRELERKAGTGPLANRIQPESDH